MRAKKTAGPFYKKFFEEHGSSTASTTQNRQDSGKNKDKEIQHTSSSTVYNVLVDVVNGTTIVSFTLDDTSYKVAIESTDNHDVISAVAEKLAVPIRSLNRNLKKAIERSLENNLEGVDDDN